MLQLNYKDDGRISFKWDHVKKASMAKLMALAVHIGTHLV
jgi:hypothetical protein